MAVQMSLFYSFEPEQVAGSYDLLERPFGDNDD